MNLTGLALQHNKRQWTDHDQRSVLEEDMRSFLTDLLKARPDLQCITLDFWATSSAIKDTELFRTIRAIRKSARGADIPVIQFYPVLNPVFISKFLETDFNLFLAQRLRSFQ